MASKIDQNKSDWNSINIQDWTHNRQVRDYRLQSTSNNEKSVNGNFACSLRLDMEKRQRKPPIQHGVVLSFR